MAYSSRGGSARGGSGRGGGSARGGGGSPAMAYGVAGILVVLVVVVFMVLSKKKPVAEIPPPPPPAASPTVVTGPAKPGEKPYPPITEAMLNEGRNLVRTFEKDAAAADRLYTESQKAKKAGDDAGWQAKLREALNLYHGINVKWNDFADRLPTGNGYDTSDVERHYFPREAGQVQKYTKLLAAMKSDLK
jgi:hypothetical protein